MIHQLSRRDQQPPTPIDWGAELKSEEAPRRHGAALYLYEHPEEARRHQGALVIALEDQDGRIRRLAAWTLSILGPAVIETLVLALSSRRAVTREWGAVLLGSLGLAANRAAPALVQATRDDDMSVRWAALQALRAVQGR